MPSYNVIYMHSHDTGRYISPYGHALPTPNMQRFAEQGVLFRQAFCAGPTCSPSRASLCTGMYPHQNGMMGLAHRGWSLHDYNKSWFKLFRDAGYRTTQIGVEHCGMQQHMGTADVYEEKLNSPTADWRDNDLAAVAFMERDHDKPFFLDVGFFETHRAETPGEPVQWHNGEDSPTGDPRYVTTPAPLPDTPDTRRDYADYAVSVERLDARYGRILEALKAYGLADNTIVLITTDHGIAFPGMKSTLSDHGMGVLMMMRGPAELGLSGGKVIDAMVSHVDVIPTLCELLGMPTPDYAEGRSMRSLLDGELDASQADALNEAVFSEVTYHAAYEPKRAVRTSRYKYIKLFHDGPVPMPANTDDSVSKNLMLSTDRSESWTRRERLYDLILDPNEAHDVSDDPGYAEALDEMRGRLDAWMKDTNDPLLDGPVPLPAGAKTNRQSDFSPRHETVEAEAFDPSDP